MQSPDGQMRMLDLNNEKDQKDFKFNPLKIVHEGQCFKIQHTFFRITNITPEGIVAKGISRKEYYNNKR